MTDEKRLGRPSTATTQANIDQIEKMIYEDRKVTTRHLAYCLSIGKTTVHHIIYDIHKFRKVCSVWVPRMLTDDQKLSRLTICNQLSQRYKNEGDSFLSRIVTGD